MRHRAAAAFSPRPARGGSTITSQPPAWRHARRGSFLSSANAFHVMRDIAAKVVKGMRRGFDCENLIEVAGEMSSEQTGAGVEIECCPAGLLRHNNFHEFVDQEAVGLKEGAAAYVIVIPTVWYMSESSPMACEFRHESRPAGRAAGFRLLGRVAKTTTPANCWREARNAAAKGWRSSQHYRD